MDFLSHLFDTSDFPARWTCGRWSSGHGWLHIISDLGVWSAYCAIPLVLVHFILRRRDLPFRKVFVLFGAFILLCGSTHLMEAVIFWWPAYRLAGVIKLLTAIISWITVLALVRVAPTVLAMRSPEELEREIAARQLAEDALQRANADLEQRVAERTRDLTEAAAILRTERELLRITLGSIGDGVIATDNAGQVTFLNTVAEQLTGWDSAAAKNVPLERVFNIVDEATRQTAENPARRAMTAGTIVGLAHHSTLIARNGTERPIDDSAAPIQDGAGKVSGAVLIFRDITAQRTQRRELEEREQQFRTLAESIPQLTWMAHADGHVFWYNRRWYDFTGTTFEQMEGWGWQSVLDPDVLPSVLSRWRGSIASGEPFEMVFPIKGSDGQFRHFLTRVLPIKDDKDRVVRWFGTNTDISDAKRVEEEIRQLAAELSESNRRKDEFLAMLAHELRNPLAPIRTGLHLLSLAPPDSAAFEKARTIMVRQVTQMVRLVDDLLDVSRINRGRIALRKEHVELATVVHSALETSGPLIEQMGHELTVALPNQPVGVDADVTRLAQVFLNLLNNAAKYTERGGHIWLTAELQGAEVVVSIRDTGIGIAATHLPSIFDMFTQVDRSREMSQGGLGIGLSLVKRLVEMHGGSVEARSEGPGQGAEFVVRLPALVALAPPTTAPIQEPAATHKVRRILIVDDNRDAANSLSEMLRLLGNETCTAYDGTQGLDMAAQFRPHVILLDLGLPTLNGHDLCRRIRAEPWGKSLILIAVTGWGQDDDRRRSREAGFDHHLTKPVELKDLLPLLA
jgi:PAS domain S-box-containing protein